MMPRQFPKALRIEAKFTTGTTIAVPKREREALIGKDEDVVGVIAALFWCGKRAVDGQWFIVDAAESFRSGRTEGGSLGFQDLLRLGKGQPWLAGLRDRIHQLWPPFLRAFRDEALAGHEVLRTELDALQKAGRLQDRLELDPVLDLEHRKAVKEILDTHGASVAGHIFQDLLAYLLALAGYSRVQINPIGVPDIEVSERNVKAAAQFITLNLTQEQIARLMKLCRKARALDLARALSPEPDSE